MENSSSGQAGLARAVFIHSSRLERYRYPPSHPFRTERAAEARKIAASVGLLPDEGSAGAYQVAPAPASAAAMETFHTARYLDALKSASQGQVGAEATRMAIGSPDCPVFEGMYEHSALACGASLAGADLILDGKVDAALNPSGGLHHAHPEMASGFCYVNDVAIACMRLARRGKRVLYLDIDAHHGDGVQEAFYSRSDVMTISFHESGRTLFPGTGFETDAGLGEGEGFSVNVPLPVGTYDEAYMRAFRALAMPLIGAFDPDVFVLQLGMDALADDPLAHLGLTNNTCADVLLLLRSLGKPILATGGGGYDVANTAKAWALAWGILSGQAAIPDVCAARQAEASEGAGSAASLAVSLRDRVVAPDARCAAVGRTGDRRRDRSRQGQRLRHPRTLARISHRFFPAGTIASCLQYSTFAVHYWIFLCSRFAAWYFAE